MKRNKKICELCGKEISLSNFSRHLKMHEKYPKEWFTSTPKYKLNHDDLICQFCGKECKNRNSLCNHERLCKENPNRQAPAANIIGFNNKGRTAWNKGLTKETHPQLALSEERKKAIGERSRNFRHSSETIAKMKANPNMGGLREGSGRGKKGRYKGYYCYSTYELVWTIYCLDHNIVFSRCKKYYNYDYKGARRRYYPDYEMEDGTLIELKGYHDELVDIKAHAVTDVPLFILYKEDLQYMFDYVRDNYSYKNLEELYDKDP